MTSFTLSAPRTRRQADRCAREVQELTRSVPGNSVCAECAEKNPGWASWNLGIFLCIRCATFHRKLGTHISRVKSLTMDTWTPEQVDSIRQKGNSASNKLYNPRGTLPDWNHGDVNQSLERFVFKKYGERAFMDTGEPTAAAAPPSRSSLPKSSASSPPPTPPPRRPTMARSVSNTFSVSSSATTFSQITGTRRQSSSQRGTKSGINVPLPATPSETFTRSPGLRSKPSQLLGESVGERGIGTTIDHKIGVLRQMGFKDLKRNETVLRSLNGNVQKSIEVLMKLEDMTAERNNAKTASAVSATSTASSASAAPASTSASTTAGSTGGNPFGGNLFQNGSQPSSVASAATTASTNPFLSPAGVSSASYQHLLPPQMVISPTAYSGQAASANFLGPQAQLFPNHTGTLVPPGQYTPFLTTYTPPPQLSSSNSFPFGQQNWMLSPPATGQQVPAQMQGGQMPFSNPTTGGSISPMSAPMSTTNPFLSQPPYNTSAGPGAPFSMDGGYLQQQQQQQQQHFIHQPQAQAFHSAASQNKSIKDSILALYSAHSPSNPSNGSSAVPTPGPSPAGASKNPFSDMTDPSRQVGVHSVPPGGATGSQKWNDGRHSPEAFASLSFRYGA